MSKLNELIQKLCPDGVGYRALKDVLTIRNGSDYKGFSEGNIPVYGSGGIIAYIDRAVYERPSVLIPRKGSIDKLYYVDTPFWNVDTVFYTDINTEIVEPKYVYHYLRREHLEKLNTAGGVPSLTQTVLNRVQLPVPPLEVQREIVRILDSFTLLTAELTAELTARKKQYEFYRNKMLTFNMKVSRKKLGEIFDFRNGLSKGKEFFGSGTPFIRYTDVYNHRALRKEDITALVECTPEELEKLRVSRGDVLFTRTSETAEDVGRSSVMLDDIGDCVFNGFTIKATPKTEELLPEYCAYCFATDDFRNYVTTHCAFTTRASLTGNAIAEYQMAIPSIDVQRKIANVLSNFEVICSDLNIGLPAEILSLIHI